MELSKISLLLHQSLHLPLPCLCVLAEIKSVCCHTQPHCLPILSQRNHNQRGQPALVMDKSPLETCPKDILVIALQGNISSQREAHETQKVIIFMFLGKLKPQDSQRSPPQG